MSSFVALQTEKGTWRHFDVAPEVSQYIRQLECFVKYPGTSKLKEMYLDRFRCSPDLLKQLQKNLDSFLEICSLHCEAEKTRCKTCKWQMKIDSLRYVMAGTEMEEKVKS